MLNTQPVITQYNEVYLFLLFDHLLETRAEIMELLLVLGVIKDKKKFF